jgi:uncharacterized membrane protein YphA (DoxX/SURF4 family)
MNKATAIFLVLLRLTIGWHFLAEGWHKLHSFLDDSPAREKAWSAAGYFREGQGPLARVIRSQIGDPDSDALALLDVKPVPAGQDPARFPPARRVPNQLAADWQRYLDAFADHYKLTKEQKAEAQVKLEQAEANVVGWLTNTDIDPALKGVPKTYQSVNYDLRRSVADRIADYRKAVLDVRTLTDRGVSLIGKDAAAARLVQAKADAAELRTGLLADLREQNTIPYQDSLTRVLTWEQRAADVATPADWKPAKSAKGTEPAAPELTPAQRAEVKQVLAAFGMAATTDEAGGVWQAASALAVSSPDAVAVQPVPEKVSNGFLTWINLLTAWGLTILGGCLLVGLLTRTSCVLAALFLLTTYLCTPPWPWFLAAPNSEGFYFFINKNVIEMLALLALATTASGRWFGLDALLHETWAFLRGRPVERPSTALATH